MPPEAGPGEGDSKRFENQLDALKGGGPYADALAEPSPTSPVCIAAPATWSRHNRPTSAPCVVRINDGLYSERQVPILRELFETYRLTGDMATLDARYDYFSGFTAAASRRTHLYGSAPRWNTCAGSEALRLGLDGEGSDRLLALYSLNEQLLQGGLRPGCRVG